MNDTELLNQSCATLSGIGPKMVETLKKCNIESIQDLLFHLPYRYQDRTRISPISDLMDRDWSVIEGEVVRQEVINGRRQSLICTLQDHTSFIRLRFFHFNRGLQQSLRVGSTVRVFGEVREIANQLEMAHPEFQTNNQSLPVSTNESLTPIYATTKGLSQKKIRQFTQLALDLISDKNLEILPPPLCQQWQLISPSKLLHFLHQPPPDAPIASILEGTHPYQQRLVLEELLSHHLSMKRLKNTHKKNQAHAIPIDETLTTPFLAALPFTLTNAQQRVAQEIINDLIKPIPMHRMVQGDVGAGKTVVAALAALPVISAGFQVALMAPTELLAEQHAQNFKDWFSPLNINVDLLLGKQGIKARKASLEKLQSGQTNFIIGTHALFQDNVEFNKLALIIIDEQHRFGVKQRQSLQQKGEHDNTLPHQLVMTATPIPRTLAMTQYANLDSSVIDELPPGRLAIKTVAMNNEKRDLIITRLSEALSQGKQAYWVCTLIEESESLQCQAAEDTATHLAEQLPEIKIGLVHGRMKANEKLAIMQAFKEKRIHLLVATTVIEVGVDVPNASLMIIENAERLGLSQLHQLRGRVGRGHQQSHCLLLFQAPLSYHAKSRLKVMRETNDGFVIAEHDLALRGCGEIIGTKQTGLQQFKMANLERDKHLFDHKIPTLANALAARPDVIEALIKRWLGNKEAYSNN